MTTAEWLSPLIAGLHALQSYALQALAALGLVDTVAGQPGWPFDWRLSGDNLVADAPNARRLAAVVVALMIAVGLAGIALVGRRHRRWLLGAAVALPLLVPWPDRSVVLVPAHPTSFHRSPTGFSAQAIVAGQALYTAHCAACHGADGRGDGPAAGRQPVWPPDFIGPLLWRRADGDLFWHIRDGVVDRHGRQTMPGFGPVLGDAGIWQVIDFLKAQSAGQSLRLTGAWRQPVRLPASTIDCAGESSSSAGPPWRGQRLRVVAPADDRPLPIEDPRLVTIALLAPTGGGTAPTGARPDADCRIDDASAWTALTLVTGGEPPAGRQWLVDRAGWLRAVSTPGSVGWSDEDLVCRSAPGARDDATAGARPDRRRGLDGLGRLLAAIDADPVRVIDGVRTH
ncbi:MAG: cytochrome c [Burkholderiaceae bacterium]